MWKIIHLDTQHNERLAQIWRKNVENWGNCATCFTKNATLRNTLMIWHRWLDLQKNTFLYNLKNHLCGLVVRIPGYRSRGPGFDSWCYQIFWEVVGLERRPLSLMSTVEELLGRKSSGSGLESRESNPDLWICRQELWPLEHRGSFSHVYNYVNGCGRWKLLTQVSEEGEGCRSEHSGNGEDSVDIMWKRIGKFNFYHTS
jgi:hypothetical protein